MQYSTKQLVFYFTSTDYSQSMNSREAIRNRLIKYLIPVILLSVTFNIPKFLEAKLVYRPADPINSIVPNSTDLNMTMSTIAANTTQKWIPMVRELYIILIEFLFCACVCLIERFLLLFLFFSCFCDSEVLRFKTFFQWRLFLRLLW
jgi:hypothetical protein